MNKQLENIIIEMLERKDNTKVDVLTKETSLRRDLDFDSLDLAELTVRVEDKFDIDIFEDGLVDTLGEILDKIS